MNIYFFGDSICFGQFVSPCYIWINLLTKELENHFSAEKLTVQNPSVNGRTTRQALEDMSFQIQSNLVDYLYVQFGMNDCNYWANDFGCPRVSKSAFEANLIEIIERARKSDTQLVFLGTNHPSEKVATSPHPQSYQQMNAEYNKIIRKVASLKKVILIDHERYWHTAFESSNYSLHQLVLPDGIHLSEQGHVIYANCACSIMINALQKHLSSLELTS